MSKIDTIFHGIVPDYLLNNTVSEKADFIRLCSDSVFWGCCHITIISKHYVQNADEALLYLLQREVIALQGIDKKQDQQTVRSFVESAISDGYFAGKIREQITLAELWNGYEETVNSIVDEPTFAFYKNGQEERFVSLLELKEVISFTSFAHEWNNRQYLIETNKDWLLFGWATMA